MTNPWPLFTRGRFVLVFLLQALASGALSTFATGTAHGEAPKFIAEVDRNQVTAGESFAYQVTLSVGNDQVSNYRPPEFKGLRVLSTPGAPNQSTQMQFGGAGMFVQISYSWRYELAAAQKGTVTIGPARVRVNGQEFRSNPVTVAALAATVTALAELDEVLGVERVLRVEDLGRPVAALGVS